MINDEQLNFMVSLKIPNIILEIIRRLGISKDKAFDMFYRSETYKLLSDRGSYYWGESAGFVTDSFIREYQGLPIEEFENI